jgi:hypothetical protein
VEHVQLNGGLLRLVPLHRWLVPPQFSWRWKLRGADAGPSADAAPGATNAGCADTHTPKSTDANSCSSNTSIPNTHPASATCRRWLVMVECCKRPSDHGVQFFAARIDAGTSA